MHAYVFVCLSFIIGNGVADDNFFHLSNECLLKIFENDTQTLVTFLPKYTLEQLNVRILSDVIVENEENDPKLPIPNSPRVPNISDSVESMRVEHVDKHKKSSSSNSHQVPTNENNENNENNSQIIEDESIEGDSDVDLGEVDYTEDVFGDDNEKVVKRVKKTDILSPYG